MARGTLVQDAGALAARLDALGANLKTDDDPRVPYDDYYTTPDYAFVRVEMPASRWREGVALLGEIVRFPRFDDASIEAVRQEILDLQKRRAESTRNRAVELMDRTLAPGHPAIRPVLGTPESVTSITRDDLLAFHRDHASGRRMILTGVSPIDPAEVLEAVRGAFGDLPQGPDLPPAAVVPVTTGPAEAREPARGGPGSSTIVIASVFDAPKEDAAALAALGAILSDRLTFRLREELGSTPAVARAFAAAR